jgi:undecaprenyl-diphosphatase
VIALLHVTYLHAAILGIVQGLTEFLPISSTAHLLIGAQILGFDDPGGVFTVMIQLGAILAVMWLYRERILNVVTGLFSRPEAQRFTVMLIVAFLPAAIAGVLLNDFVSSVLYESPKVFGWAFIAGGIVMLAVERLVREPMVLRADETPVARAFGIGLFQTLALVPGVSRSGATIVGGLLMRLDRAAAAEFSFFLAMPTMAAAFAYKLWEVRHELSAARAGEIGIGFVMAFLAALVVVRPFLRFVARSGFAPFAWYRIVVGVGILAAVGRGWL